MKYAENGIQDGIERKYAVSEAEEQTGIESKYADN